MLRLMGAPALTHGVLTARLTAVHETGFGDGRLAAAEPVVTNTIPFATAGDPLVPGSGAWTLGYQVPEYKAGRTYLYEALLADPLTGAKTVRSNVLRVTYGP
jgi:hypothetical protein